jgi:signal transduction histidine kinase
MGIRQMSDDRREEYDPRDIDYSLREIVHNLHARIDQVFYGLYDDFSDSEKTRFAQDLKQQASLMYNSINEAIVEKANELNSLNKIISSMNGELHDKNQELKENQEFKDFLYHMIVHDMKNPLVAILGYSDALLQMDDLQGVFRKYVRHIKNSSVFLQMMIMNLLDISKIEDNKLVPENVDTNLSDIIKKALVLFELHTDIKSITVNEELDYADTISLDSDLIERVFINILSNSFKHTPMNGQITVKTYAEDDLIVIEFQNTGPTIPKEIREKIFDKFFTHKSKTKYQSGTGLGLTFCKLATETCGGSIHVKSPVNDDGGTGFVISFPKKILVKK